MTKKINILTIACCLLATSVFSQGFHLGLKGGADLQKLKATSFSDEFAFGYHIGGFAEVAFSKTFGIQPELYYSSTKLDTAANFSSVYGSINSSKLNFGYINIPVLLNIKPSKFIAFQVGPKYSILNKKQVSLVANGKDAFKNGDLSVVAGAQLRLGAFLVYGRYQVGVSKISEVTTQDKWKNQVVHIGLGLNLF